MINDSELAAGDGELSDDGGVGELCFYNFFIVKRFNDSFRHAINPSTPLKTSPSTPLRINGSTMFTTSKIHMRMHSYEFGLPYTGTLSESPSKLG